MSYPPKWSLTDVSRFLQAAGLSRESDLQINKRSSWWKNSIKELIVLEERLIASLARSMLTVVDSRGTFATWTEIHFLQRLA